jgi:WD repeat-containing protein 22
MRENQVNSMTMAQRTIQLGSENTDVKFHPTAEHLFASSDARTGLKLRDTRMAFGPLSSRSKNGVVQTYCDIVSQRGQTRAARPEISSFKFDTDGNRIITTMLVSHPFIPILFLPLS